MHAPIVLRYNLFPLIEDVKRKTSEEENFSSRGSRAGRCVSDPGETRRTGLTPDEEEGREEGEKKSREEEQTLRS